MTGGVVRARRQTGRKDVFTFNHSNLRSAVRPIDYKPSSSVAFERLLPNVRMRSQEIKGRGSRVNAWQTGREREPSLTERGSTT